MTATSPTHPDPSGSTRAPHLLRDLDRPQRVVAAVLVLLLAVPFVVSAASALADDWIPSGDDAVIAVRVHDVFTAHPPLTGLPSTSDLYGGGIETNHLGPMEFYLLALPVKVLGLTAGMLLGAGAINLAAVLIALWVVLRRAGPAVALWASVVLALVMFSAGLAVLTDPISSNIGGYPLLCAAILAWALACGDHRLLPLTAGVVSFTAQQHLAVTPVVAIVTAWGIVGFCATVGRGLAHRWRELWPWAAAAAGVALVAWLPVAIDQFTGDPGNITAVVRFAQDSDRPTLGLRSGMTQALRAAGWPPWILRQNASGDDVGDPLDAVGVASGAAVLAFAGVVAVVGWRRRPTMARLGASALVIAGAGVLSGASVPDSLESDRINLYRWTWALALVATVLVGWSAGLAARWLSDRRGSTALTQRPGLPSYASAAVLVTVALVVSLAATADGRNEQRRDQALFAIDRRLGAAAERVVGGAAKPVLVVDDGGMANLSVAPSIKAQLADAGVRFEVPAIRENAYGDDRTFEPSDVGPVLLVVSRFGPLPELPGRRVASAELNPDLAGPVDRLVEAINGGEVVPAPEAPELLRTRLLPFLAAEAKRALDQIETDPGAALGSQEALLLLDAGYLQSPSLPKSDIDTLFEASGKRSLKVWGDDRVGLQLMTVDELRGLRPDLFE